MKRSNFLTLAAAGLAVALGSAAVAEDAHEMREKLMKGMGAQLGVLGPMAQGKKPYDAAAAQAAADELAKLAEQDFAPFFPEGSDMDTTGTGKALPAIWENMDDFSAKHTALAEAAAQLASVAGTGAEAMTPALMAVGGACAGCHKSYRAPN